MIPNCLSQDKPRKLKLVSSKPPGNEDSKYGRKGGVWDKLAHIGSGNSNTMNLMKKTDSSLSHVTYLWATLLDFFYILP